MLRAPRRQHRKRSPASLTSHPGGYIWCDEDAQTPLSEIEWVQAAFALVQVHTGKSRGQSEDLSVTRRIEGRQFKCRIPGEVRDRFLNRLTAFVDRPSHSTMGVARDLHGSLLRGVTCEPYLVVEESRIHRRYRIKAGPAHAVLDYVTALLLDDDLKLRRRLSRCRSCGHVYLKSFQQRRYCSDECTQQANRKGSAERVAAMRLGMTVDEYRAKRRRVK